MDDPLNGGGNAMNGSTRCTRGAVGASNTLLSVHAAPANAKPPTPIAKWSQDGRGICFSERSLTAYDTVYRRDQYRQ